LNREYPSRKWSSRKNEKGTKDKEKCKGLLDRFVAVASGTGEPVS